ncbi:MAG: hypothetical protein ACPF8V_10965 [Luteibaculum sp.]
MRSILFIAAILVLSLVSCKKEEKNEIKAPEQQIPSITVNSVSDSAKFNSGDTVWIIGSFADPVELHEFSIEVKHAQYDTLMASVYNGHSHEKQVDFNQYWVADVHDHTDLHLVFKASNHNDVETEKRIPIHVHPMGHH